MTEIKRTMPFGLIALMLFAAACGDDDGGAARPDAGPEADADVGMPDAGDGVPDAAPPAAEREARFVIEHNAAVDETGFRIAFDGEPWTALSVTGPSGEVLGVDALAAMADFGLTEMRLRTDRPSADETARDDVLSLFPEGDYTFQVTSIGGEVRTFDATLSHELPSAAQIRTPAADAAVPSDNPVVVTWNAVTGSVEGTPLDIVGYRVIVGRDLDLDSGEGFSDPVLDVTVPASVTSVAIPAEFLRPGTPYTIEVRALAASGNETISSRAFATSGTATDDLTEVAPPGSTQLGAAKYLIDHDATNEDTGYEIYLDGAPWNRAWVQTPASADLVQVRTRGNLATFGLTEMFFETSRPPASQVPLADVLALFPEGRYEMFAIAIEGMTQMTDAATLSHKIPAPGAVTKPAADGEVDPTQPLEVTWDPVMTSLDGDAANVVAYQLTVARATQDAAASAGRLAPTFSVRVPADTTSMTVPAAFLEPGTAYEIEVSAIETSGNQTKSVRPFETAASAAAP